MPRIAMYMVDIRLNNTDVIILISSSNNPKQIINCLSNMLCSSLCKKTEVEHQTTLMDFGNTKVVLDLSKTHIFVARKLKCISRHII